MSRSRSTMRGKPVKRLAARTIVVTEGEVTEPRYLRDFRYRFRIPAVEIIPAGGDPQKVVKRALAEMRRLGSNWQKGRDTIWVMFDRDKHAQLKQAIANAKKKGIEVVVSNPCFELWCLLHYQDQEAFIEGKRCQELLEKCSEYNQRGRLFEGPVIREKYCKAKKRAEKILNDRKADGEKEDPYGNPSCTVHLLTEHFHRVAAEFKDG